MKTIENDKMVEIYNNDSDLIFLIYPEGDLLVEVREDSKRSSIIIPKGNIKEVKSVIDKFFNNLPDVEARALPPIEAKRKVYVKGCPNNQLKEMKDKCEWKGFTCFLCE